MATDDLCPHRKAKTDKRGTVPPSFVPFILTAESAETAEETERKNSPRSAFSASSAVNFLMTRMTLRKKWSLALVFLATSLGLFAFPSAARSATTFTVTTIADPGDGTCTAAGTGDGCTLREAIAAANTAGDAIIVFAAGVTGTIQLTTALPDLSKNMSVQGPGANLLTVRRNSSAVYRIFTARNNTSSGPTVIISGLGIANGLGEASGDNFGGAIYGHNATLTVTGCMISGNDGGFGGGIDNRAEGGSATLSVQSCTFSTNQSDFGGGAILNESYSSGTAAATVRNCTFTGNGSVAGGGGIKNFAHGGSATLTVQNCTFSGNGSNSSTVGGIYNKNDLNSPGFSATTEIGTTIFQAGSGPNLGNFSVSGGVATMTSLGYNLSNDDGGGFLVAAGDQTQIDSKLDPAGLQDNGGPLQTIALQSTSPAFNAGDPNFTPPPNFDERGFNRVARGRLDIGAFELQDTVQSGTTLIVNTTVDHDDGVCGTADCTLREAINAANAASGADTITFAANVTGTITLTQGELSITKAMTITGPGARVLAVDANLASRVFAIGSVIVNISDLTLTRGQLGGLPQGGAIFSAANMTLTRCTISHSSVIGDAVVGSPGNDGFGGGIYNSGTLTLVGCTVSDNSALGGSFSTTGNSVDTGGTGRGGGIYNVGTLTLQNCTFSANTAQGGRGGHNPLLGSGHGGNGGNGFGGAVGDANKLTVTNCTLSANSAVHGLGGTGKTNGVDGTGEGGGIYRSSTSSSMVGNALIAGNTGADGGPDVFGSFTSKGFNLIGKTDGGTGFTATGDKTGTVASPLDPKLGSLANYSGPTDTMALLTGSPAIDAGNDATAPATDQRGAPRVGQSDIGAYEFGGALPTPTPTPIPTATPTPNPTPTATPISVPTSTPTPTPIPTTTPSPNPTPTPTPGSLGNISTRLQVGTGNNVLFAGFIIQGSGSKTVLIRSAGPSLTSFGLPGALSDPRLELHDANNTIGINDDWQTTQLGGVITSDQVAAIQNSGAVPLDPAEPAIIATLPAGGYTAIVQGVGGTQGIATVEVYDLSPNNGATLANISTRGFIQTGDNVMIGGFIVVGQSSKVLIRATGPSLIPFGINNALANPRIELHDANGALAGNDDWQTTQLGGIITSDQSAAIQNSGLAPGNPAESAIIATLAPGAYTAIAQGVNGGTGVGLVEVFALP